MLVPTMTYQEISKEVSLDLKELNENAKSIIDKKISSKYKLFKEAFRRNGNMPFQLKENKNSVIIKTSRGNKWTLIITDLSIYKRNDYQYLCTKYIIVNKDNGGREVLCPCIIPNTDIIKCQDDMSLAVLRFEAHLFRRFKERYILRKNPDLIEEDLSFEEIANIFFTNNDSFPFNHFPKEDSNEDENAKTLITRAKTKSGILLGEENPGGEIRYKTFITEDMLKDYQEILKPGNELDQMLNKKILNLYE